MRRPDVDYWDIRPSAEGPMFIRNVIEAQRAWSFVNDMINGIVEVRVIRDSRLALCTLRVRCAPRCR
jgi:hypothetical protein